MIRYESTALVLHPNPRPQLQLEPFKVRRPAKPSLHSGVRQDTSNPTTRSFPNIPMAIVSNIDRAGLRPPGKEPMV